MTTQEIIEVIKGLTVLELNDLVKACEEEFGVSAAAALQLQQQAQAQQLKKKRQNLTLNLQKVLVFQ